MWFFDFISILLALFLKLVTLMWYHRHKNCSGQGTHEFFTSYEMARFKNGTGASGANAIALVKSSAACSNFCNETRTLPRLDHTLALSGSSCKRAENMASAFSRSPATAARRASCSLGFSTSLRFTLRDTAASASSVANKPNGNAIASNPNVVRLETPFRVASFDITLALLNCAPSP